MTIWQAWKVRICCAILWGAMSTQAAVAIPVLAVSATPNPATRTSTITADVSVTGAVNLYGYNFSLAFNPSVLQFVGAVEGSFLGSAGTTFFGAGDVDNIAGTLSFAYNTLLGDITGASGGGLLERLTFSVKNPGTSTLAFSDVTFVDSSQGGNGSSVQAVNGSVLVIGAVPEPEVVLLLGAGLGALALARRRRAA